MSRRVVGVCRGLLPPFSSEAGLAIQSKGTLLMKMVGDFVIAETFRISHNGL